MFQPSVQPRGTSFGSPCSDVTFRVLKCLHYGGVAPRRLAILILQNVTVLSHRNQELVDTHGGIYGNFPTCESLEKQQMQLSCMFKTANVIRTTAFKLNNLIQSKLVSMQALIHNISKRQVN